MKSLNLQIFEKLNRLIGRNRYLDAFARVCAEFLILLLLAFFGFLLLLQWWPDYYTLAKIGLIFGFLWGLGMTINWVIGKMVRSPRPYVKNPNYKSLFRPLMDNKSFPSDHAMSSFLILFSSIILDLPAWPVLLTLTLLIVAGRVYSGVHYPRDIVGGASVALFVSLGMIFWWFMGI
jgi:undecaprenyl-diphosphatase